MTELALMTVEITLTDRDSRGFGLGGPKEQALAMATALAQRLNMATPPDGRLLNVSMTAAELRPIVEWNIMNSFLNLGFVHSTISPCHWPGRSHRGAVSILVVLEMLRSMTI